MNIFLMILLLILVVAVLALIFEIYRELHCFRITRYSVWSKKLSGTARDVKILFLSDLHNRTYGKDNEKLLGSIRSEKPDLILIGGDMLVGKENIPYNTALKFLAELPGICPVIYANGNHEQRMKEDTKTYGDAYALYKKTLTKRGIYFLENQSIRVELGSAELIIYGLELPPASYKKFKKTPLTAQKISGYFREQKTTGNAQNGGKKADKSYRILMAHNPAYMDAYLEWGADMILSGHLHGGLVRVPVLGGIVTPQGFLFPKYSGEMTEVGDQTVIVSRGLGTHTLNIRFFNTPELVCICLGGE
ncbi:MAG TPA: metallophosphoesterase [Candidatus Mediterraneibacter pullicola]|uniref:Metallophosphoesterase n=1 Tax=Candidatus Mediterraneibacter pullicola TaxID=2838682 RepID=A0A9D2KKG6_9FIRM|nr:metallophosphoesterase [Candidatus Mediterraneibacter pullicola]